MSAPSPRIVIAGGGLAGLSLALALKQALGESLDVVMGETVTWTNDSVRVHTVTADDGSFDSGRMPTRATFTRNETASYTRPAVEDHAAATAADPYRRRVLSTIIELRNLGASP